MEKRPGLFTDGISPVSSVRIRIAFSIGRTKILPSPILPVLAESGDRFNRLFDDAVDDHDFEFDLGQEVDRVFAAAVDFGMALLTTEALHPR